MSDNYCNNCEWDQIEHNHNPDTPCLNCRKGDMWYESKDVTIARQQATIEVLLERIDTLDRRIEVKS